MSYILNNTVFHYHTSGVAGLCLNYISLCYTRKTAANILLPVRVNGRYVRMPYHISLLRPASVFEERENKEHPASLVVFYFCDPPSTKSAAPHAERFHPASSTYFVPGSEVFCDYSLTLARLLTGRALLPKMEQMLTGLTCELVWCFAAELKVPRWIRTADGVKFIDEVTA
ncbi:hypothetical protein [Klebsiella quasipneumoniae]|uniref:hypothetical protein n=1 Tax=Klebsiella quasipneumoniae TaxID=1463165 RepID=UPI00254CFB94|nr:hypothetical protein [Klebsiella quasipneumoniae]MEC5635937.1 hypothetical protein [Klebsiella quasipneumoniae]